MAPMRCQHYFDNGEPIRDGCHYLHNCRYVHPADYDWDDAEPPVGNRERLYAHIHDFRRGSDPHFDRTRSTHRSGRWPPPAHGQRPRSRSRSPRSPSRSRYTDVGPGRGHDNGYGHRRRESIASSVGSAAAADMGKRDLDYGSPSKPNLMDVVDPSPTTASFRRSPPPLPPPPSSAGSTTTTATERAIEDLGNLHIAPQWPSAQRRPPEPIFAPPPPPSSAPPLTVNTSSVNTMNPPPPTSAPLQRPAPPPPKSAPTMPLGPIPGPPDLPSALQLNKDTSVQSAEDTARKAKQWEERAKSIADSVLAYESIQALQEDYDTAQQALNSVMFSALSSAAQERLVAQSKELKTRIDAARATLVRQRDVLVHQVSWPTAPPRKGTKEEEQQYVEIKGYVRELNEEVMNMKELIASIEEIKRTGKVGDYKGKGKEKVHEEDAGGDDSMLVDDEGGDGSSTLPQASGASNRKKRKLATGEASLPNDEAPPASGSRNAKDISSPNYIPTTAEIETMRDILREYGRDISDMQNEVTRAKEDWADIIRVAVEKEIDAERERRDAVMEEREREAAVEREREKEDVRRRLEEVKGQTRDLGAQVTEVTESLAELVIQSGRLEEQVEERRRVRDGNTARLDEIDRKMKEYADRQARNVEAISTLRTALEAYLTQPPSPPVSPPPTATFPSAITLSASASSSSTTASSSTPLPPIGYILEALEPTLTDVARAALRPQLERLRAEVEEAIRANNGEMYKAFFEKTSKMRRVLDAIYERMPHLAVAQYGANGQGHQVNGTRAGGSGSAGPPGNVKAPSGTSTRTA